MSFLFKCAIKHISADNHTILLATETGTQVVSPEDVQALTEISANKCERCSSKLHAMMRFLHADPHGVGSATSSETWKRTHPTYSSLTPAMALADLMRVMPSGMVKSHRELLATFEGWHVRVDVLSRHHEGQAGCPVHAVHAGEHDHDGGRVRGGCYLCIRRFRLGDLLPPKSKRCVDRRRSRRGTQQGSVATSRGKADCYALIRQSLGALGLAPPVLDSVGWELDIPV